MMKGLIFIAFLLLPTISKACLCNGVTPATCATAPCTIQCGLCRSSCCAIPFIGRKETGKDCYISEHFIKFFVTISSNKYRWFRKNCSFHFLRIEVQKCMHTYYFKYFESILILGPSCKSSLWMPGVQWHTVGHDCQKCKETHIRPMKEKKMAWYRVSGL